MIDLTQLPSPDVIETLDYEQIYQEKLARFQSLYPDYTAALESDPVVKLLELSAYDELLLRQRINDAAAATMLAYASMGDLDQLGSNYGVQRLLIIPADPDSIPPVAAVYEQDASFRMRIQESWSRLSCAGPRDSYAWHAKSASGLVKDVAAISPAPGCVTVFVLSSEGDGTASAELLAVVDAALSDQAVRPLTDAVTVQSAAIIPYAITAELIIYPGPDAAVVTQAALAAVRVYADAQRRLDRDVVQSGILAALHQPGVQRVILHSPSADIVVSKGQAAHCTGITITQGGISA